VKTKAHRGKPASAMAGQFQEWLEERRDLLPRSRDDYGRDCQRLVEFFATQGADCATQVTRKMAEAYATMLEKSGRRTKSRGRSAGLAKSTVKKRLAIASSFFADLAADELIAKDPFATVRAPKLPKRKLVCPTFDEAQDLINDIGQLGWLDARLRLLLGFAQHTGARISEILGANWGDFDFTLADHGMVKLRGKGDKERDVPLSKWFAEELQRYRKYWGPGAKGMKNAAVFVGRKGGRLQAKAVYAAIERKGLRSKYGLHPHLLRHTFGTTLANGGVPVHVIADLMGHASIASAEIYIHATGAQSKTAIRVLDWLMGYVDEHKQALADRRAGTASRPPVVYGRAQSVGSGTSYLIIPLAPVVPLALVPSHESSDAAGASRRTPRRAA
jgi:site-specific recombinase XerD